MNWSYREPTLDEDLVRLHYQSLDGGRWDRPQELAAALREVGLELVRGSARACSPRRVECDGSGRQARAPARG
jgi:hypothetical protein